MADWKNICSKIYMTKDYDRCQGPSRKIKTILSIFNKRKLIWRNSSTFNEKAEKPNRV